MKLFTALVLMCLTFSVPSAFSDDVAPVPQATPAVPSDAPAEPPVVAPVEGRDSRWRTLLNLGVGSLEARGDGDANVLERDYEKGSGFALGILQNFRSSRSPWGVEFGLKFLNLRRKSKTSDLGLSLNYLAIPLELRYKLAPVRKRSSIFLKGGLTYLVLLTASVSDLSASGDKDGDSDWDWDDAYPSPPTKGSYRGSFNKTDLLASVGGGLDIMLFQVRNSFNMTLIPELMYYKGLTTISKSGEFNGDVHNEGMLVNLSLGFGF